MIPLSSASSRMPGMRIILVLQADQALWFKWSEGELVDSVVESVHCDNLQQKVRCPWMPTEDGATHHSVELILDTPLDELDKLKADTTSNGGYQLAMRWRLMRRMKRDYPHAAIHALPRHMTPDIMSIHHQVIPDAWGNWLSRLQLNDVVVTHVVTTTELLARLQHSLSAPVLFQMDAGIEERHLLVDQAIPVFMRLASKESIDADAAMLGGVEPCADKSALPEAAVKEIHRSLVYISNNVLQMHPSVSVLTPSTPFAGISTSSNAACVLSALCVNIPVDFTHRRWEEGSLCSPQLEPISVRLPEHGSPLLRVLHHVFERLLGPFPQAGSTSLNEAFSVSGNRCKATQYLQSSVSKRLFRQRINGLRNATVLSALMAIVTMVFAASHGIDSARQRAQLGNEHDKLVNANVNLSAAVLALHQSPDYVFQSLQRIKEHKSIKPLEPQFLMATVASAITDFPALMLDTLSWSVIDEGESVGAGLAVGARMAGRQQLWTQVTHPTQIQIELSGAVVSGQSLRSQQKAVKSFVKYLEAVPGISSVHVLESPVQAARSSEVLVDNGARYRLSLVLGAS